MLKYFCTVIVSIISVGPLLLVKEKKIKKTKHFRFSVYVKGYKKYSTSIVRERTTALLETEKSAI